MICYRALALIALIGILMLTACGGGAKGIDLVTNPSITPVHSPNVAVLGASGLKPQLHLTYSLEGHSSANSFTVVPYARFHQLLRPICQALHHTLRTNIRFQSLYRACICMQANDHWVGR